MSDGTVVRRPSGLARTTQGRAHSRDLLSSPNRGRRMIACFGPSPDCVVVPQPPSSDSTWARARTSNCTGSRSLLLRRQLSGLHGQQLGRSAFRGCSRLYTKVWTRGHHCQCRRDPFQATKTSLIVIQAEHSANRDTSFALPNRSSSAAPG